MSYGSDAFVRRCRQHLFAFSAQYPSLLLPTVSDRFILYSSMVHGGGFMGLHYPHGRSMLHAPGAALPRRTLAEARVYLLVLLMYGIIVNTVQIEHLIYIFNILYLYIYFIYNTKISTISEKNACDMDNGRASYSITGSSPEPRPAHSFRLVPPAQCAMPQHKPYSALRN